MAYRRGKKKLCSLFDRNRVILGGSGMYCMKEDGDRHDYASTTEYFSYDKIDRNPRDIMAGDLLYNINERRSSCRTPRKRGLELGSQCYSSSIIPSHPCISYSASSYIADDRFGRDLVVANRPSRSGNRTPFPYSPFPYDPVDLPCAGKYSPNPEHAAGNQSPCRFFPDTNVLDMYASPFPQSSEDVFPHGTSLRRPSLSLSRADIPSSAASVFCASSPQWDDSTARSKQSSQSASSSKPSKKRRKHRKKKSSIEDESPSVIAARAFDRDGCRALQAELDRKGAAAVETLLAALGERLSQLLTHPYGNYLFQKLVEVASDAQRRRIVRQTAACLPYAANTLQGTRCVQSLIKSTGDDVILHEIVRIVVPHVVALCCNKNGNHVIQLLLGVSSKEFLQPLYEELVTHCYEIALNCFGCSVVIKCIDSFPSVFKLRILDTLRLHTVRLVTDPYGNYAIQHILKVSTSQSVIASFCQCMLGHIVVLSQQKCSSNVVELGIQLAGEELRDKMIDELLNSPLLPQVLFNEYGNFVIQIALTHCGNERKEAFTRKISPYLAQLNAMPNGYHVISKLQQGTYPS